MHTYNLIKIICADLFFIAFLCELSKNKIWKKKIGIFLEIFWIFSENNISLEVLGRSPGQIWVDLGRFGGRFGQIGVDWGRLGQIGVDWGNQSDPEIYATT